MTPRNIGGPLQAAAVLAAIVALAFPRLVAAHAELVRANPADGETVTRPVTAVTGRYSEGLISGSRLVIKDASGATVGTGGIDPENERRMIARFDPALTEGDFTVGSTARSADGHVERATWSFTVAVPPSPSATPSPSVGESPTAASSATVAPSPTASPSPAASPPPTDPASATSVVLLPIVAALALVAIGAGFLLNRSRTSRR